MWSFYSALDAQECLEELLIYLERDDSRDGRFRTDCRNREPSNYWRCPNCGTLVMAAMRRKKSMASSEQRMDVRSQVLKILMALSNADELLQRRSWSEAVVKYAEASALLMALPQSEPFDRMGFLASCMAGTAAACAGLGEHTKALMCAEEALTFFGRVGGMYPAERGKWLLVVITKGIASAVLGRKHDAEECRRRASQMLSQSPAGMKFRDVIDHFDVTFDDVLRGDSVEAKSWWQFWK